MCIFVNHFKLLVFKTSLFLGDEYNIHLDGASVTMRNIQHRRSSLSSNSRSLDTTFIESFNVKIHVNDLTPAASQECLNFCSSINETDLYSSRLLNDGTNICKTSNIGGTTSKRLAKRANKKVPTRRQSWSSLGASISSPDEDDKQIIQRRWSLSSLDSDTEETFCKSSNTSASFRSKNSRSHSSRNATLSQTSRTLSGTFYLFIEFISFFCFGNVGLFIKLSFLIDAKILENIYDAV